MSTLMTIRRQPSRVALLFVAAILVAPTMSMAHHAFAAEYDGDKPLEVTGVVNRIRFTNPHSWLYLDVTGADGAVTTWGFEFGSPNALAGAGLSRDDIKPGTKVRINGFRAKAAGPIGYAAKLTLPDGRSVKTGGAGDAPGTAAGNTGAN